MAGEGKRFQDAGYSAPKPFIDVKGKTMLEVSLESLYVEGGKFILIARSSHLVGYESVMTRIQSEYPTSVITVDGLTEGMLSTVLVAVDQINNETPLLIGACDQVVDVPMSVFVNDAQQRKLDGSVMTFYATHSKWSYTKVAENGLVTEVREKEPISNHANVGLYYYAKGRDFVTAASQMITHNEKIHGEFYVAPTYNYAIAKGTKIGIYEIEESQMHGLGTPEDLQQFLRLPSDEKER